MGQMKAIARLLPSLPFLAVAFAVAVAHAQNPEKFERVVPEKPLAPAAPKRTSTFEVGVGISGLNVSSAKGSVRFDIGPQACRDECLRMPTCGAWAARNSGASCQLFQTITERREDSRMTAGEIREAAPAPDLARALMRELIRKAEAGDRDNGFCQRVSRIFPIDLPANAWVQAGGTYAQRNTLGCAVITFAPGFVEYYGVKFKKAVYWHCANSDSCSVEREAYFCDGGTSFAGPYKCGGPRK
jgi:hypothetical protein